MTHGEKLLWRELRNRKLGVKFRRQHPIGEYILDFYSEEARLAVEVDGPHHAEQHDYDERRDEVLNSLGIGVLRLEADAVVIDLAAQIRSITSRLNG